MLESRGRGEADSPRERARTDGSKTEDRPAPPLPRATGFCRQGISTSAWITATPPGKYAAGEEGPPPIAGPLDVPAALLGPANTTYQKPKNPHWHASHPILQKHHSSLFTETPHHGKLETSTGTWARGAVDKPTRPLVELHVHSHRTVATREAPGPRHGRCVCPTCFHMIRTRRTAWRGQSKPRLVVTVGRGTQSGLFSLHSAYLYVICTSRMDCSQNVLGYSNEESPFAKNGKKKFFSNIIYPLIHVEEFILKKQTNTPDEHTSMGMSSKCCLS